MRLRKLALCGAAVLTVLAVPAVAEGALAPGFWSFTYEPGASDAVLDDYCSNGFMLVIDGTRRLSFYVEGNRLINDGIDTCAFDAASGTQTCNSKLWNGEKMADTSARTVYSTDANGILKAVTTAPGEEGTTTYPLQCRAEIVSDVLSKALSPQR